MGQTHQKVTKRLSLSDFSEVISQLKFHYQIITWSVHHIPPERVNTIKATSIQNKFKNFSFLNPFVFQKGLSWDLSFFQVYSFWSTDSKPYSATFGQLSSKSDDTFSSYKTYSLIIPLNPLNPITYKDQFWSHLIHLTILVIVSIHN